MVKCIFVPVPTVAAFDLQSPLKQTTKTLSGTCTFTTAFKGQGAIIKSRKRTNKIRKENFLWKKTRIEKMKKVAGEVCIEEDTLEEEVEDVKEVPEEDEEGEQV